MSALSSTRLVGHLYPFAIRGIDGENQTKEKMAALLSISQGGAGAGYAQLQFTKPTTVGYGLNDSPVGEPSDAAFAHIIMSQAPSASLQKVI